MSIVWLVLYTKPLAMWSDHTLIVVSFSLRDTSTPHGQGWSPMPAQTPPHNLCAQDCAGYSLSLHVRLADHPVTVTEMHLTLTAVAGLSTVTRRASVNTFVWAMHGNVNRSTSRMINDPRSRSYVQLVKGHQSRSSRWRAIPTYSH